MTVFYVLLYYIWLENYEIEKDRSGLTIAVWVLAVIRIILCLFPQNGWLENSSDMKWGIIRNIPFIMLGAIICLLYYQKKTTLLYSDRSGCTFCCLFFSIFPLLCLRGLFPCWEC